MKGNHRGLLAFLLMGVLLLAASTPASAELTAYGEVSDPVGDSMDPSADLVFGSISITSTGDAIFRAFYGPGYDPTDTETKFALDIDKNPLTGQAWLGMGVEGVVQVYGTAFGGTGGYWTPGTPWPWPSLGAATYLPDGVEITVPLTTLGTADGLMNFNVYTQIRLAPDTWTTIRDFIPDLDDQTWTVGVGVVEPVPVPAAVLLGVIGLSSAAACLRRRRAS